MSRNIKIRIRKNDYFWTVRVTAYRKVLGMNVPTRSLRRSFSIHAYDNNFVINHGKALANKLKFHYGANVPVFRQIA